MIEIWKDIKGYEGIYRVSNLGRIKSNARIHFPDKILCPQSAFGYKVIALCKNGKRKNYMVHRLVAGAFISNPHNHPDCGHENDCKWDNRAENLYWTTKHENSMHNGISMRHKPKKVKVKTKPEMTYEQLMEQIMIDHYAYR